MILELGEWCDHTSAIANESSATKTEIRELILAQKDPKYFVNKHKAQLLRMDSFFVDEDIEENGDWYELFNKIKAYY